jgi:signal peptidase II
MNQESRIKNFYCFIAFVAFDQISKHLIRRLGGFYVCNPGISWGISVPEYIFWILWMAIISFLLLLLFKKTLTFDSYFLIVILAGAISNIVDRIRLGCVVDFIDLKFWPVFNLADIFIVLGAVFLLVRWKKL